LKRILVIRGGAIGDFVLTLPAIKLLRDNYPQAHLEILGYKHIVALAENRFYAQAVRSIEYAALASFFAKGADLPAELCDYFAGFDLVVSYLFDPDRIFETNLNLAGVEIFLPCVSKVAAGEHAARQLARSLKDLDLSLTDPAARIYPSLGDQASADQFLAASPLPMVALHPGSGSETKNWPIDRWQQLAAWLLQSRHASTLLIVGGEADENEIAALSDLAGSVRAENLPLPLLAAILQKCALFIGHDSGISHIAAAVGTPCCLLFGPTDPATWAPANPSVRVIKAPNERLSDLDLEEVKSAVYELIRIGIRT
jgi:heptosyltransferase-3